MTLNHNKPTKLSQQSLKSPLETGASDQREVRLHPRYGVKLRVGFETRFSGAPVICDRNWRKDLDIDVWEHPLDSSVAELLGDLDRSDCSHFVFVDDVFDCMERVIAELNIVLDANPSLDVLTFRSSALANLHVDGVGPDESKLLPPWFCVLSRRVLRKYGSDLVAYSTFEYSLLELTSKLQADGIASVVSDAMDLQFDYEGWVTDLLLKNSSRFEADWQRIQQSVDKQANAIAVPDQFKVRHSGDYKPLPAVSISRPAPEVVTASSPTFSVICPVFKSSFVKELVESVIQQSCSDWEFIMIVDGPPEAECERIVKVLETYSAEDRINWMVQENRGTGPTRKRLAEMARGRIVVPIDDDDRLHPELLMSFKRAHDAYPNAKVFRGGTQVFGLIDTYLTPRQRVRVNGISADIFEVTQPYAVQREALVELGGYEGDQTYGEAGEDTDLFLKIDHAGLETCLIDQPLYFRRIAAVNQTLSFDPEVCHAHLMSLIKRHLPSDQELVDVKYAGDQDGFMKSAVVYRNRRTGHQIVTATRFFDFQTLGTRLDVTIDLEVTALFEAVSIPDSLDGDTRNNRWIETDLIGILARELAQREVKSKIVIGGSGEPTLHPQLIEIVRQLAEAGASITVRTTGHTINADLLGQLIDAGLAEIEFSLNAHTANVYRKIMSMNELDGARANLSAILEYVDSHHPEFRVQAGFVYCKQNQSELVDFVSEWKDSGISSIRVHPLTRRGGVFRRDLISADLTSIPGHIVDEDIVTVETDQHRPEDGNVCKIIQKTDFIGVDGEMLLCGLDCDRKLTLGDLRISSLGDLHLSKFLRYKRGEINHVCGGCEFCP